MCEWYKYMVTMVAQVTLVVADPKSIYCKHITSMHRRMDSLGVTGSSEIFAKC